MMTHRRPFLAIMKKQKRNKNCQNAPLFSNGSSKKNKKLDCNSASFVVVTGSYVFLKHNNM
jgi:hypothetical protein